MGITPGPPPNGVHLLDLLQVLKDEKAIDHKITHTFHLAFAG
jgi:hypothetical protein